jgi:hypothetical protein
MGVGRTARPSSRVVGEANRVFDGRLLRVGQAKNLYDLAVFESKSSKSDVSVAPRLDDSLRELLDDLRNFDCLWRGSHVVEPLDFGSVTGRAETPSRPDCLPLAPIRQWFLSFLAPNAVKRQALPPELRVELRGRLRQATHQVAC